MKKKSEDYNLQSGAGGCAANAKSERMRRDRSEAHRPHVLSSAPASSQNSLCRSTSAMAVRIRRRARISKTSTRTYLLEHETRPGICKTDQYGLLKFGIHDTCCCVSNTCGSQSRAGQSHGTVATERRRETNALTLPSWVLDGRRTCSDPPPLSARYT